MVIDGCVLIAAFKLVLSYLNLLFLRACVAFFVGYAFRGLVVFSREYRIAQSVFLRLDG